MIAKIRGRLILFSSKYYMSKLRAQGMQLVSKWCLIQVDPFRQVAIFSFLCTHLEQTEKLINNSTTCPSHFILTFKIKCFTPHQSEMFSKVTDTTMKFAVTLLFLFLNCFSFTFAYLVMLYAPGNVLLEASIYFGDNNKIYIANGTNPISGYTATNGSLIVDD